MAAADTTKAIVIDTEQDAKNFYLQLFAFLTGETACTAIGTRVADKVAMEIVHASWWEKNTIPVTTEADHKKAVRPWRTPGWFADASGNHFLDTEENFEIAQKAAIKAVRSSQEAFLEPILRRLQEQDFATDPTGWTRDNCEKAVQLANENIAAARSADPRRPSYMSVAIFVKTFPPQEVVDEMVDRISDFIERRGRIGQMTNTKIKELTITGIRKIDKADGTDSPLYAANMAMTA
ncbi:hypothetical protein [Rhizobium sp. MHM7A]|uniref:hypothetical protein n=1 Tax=Rhizobium sp. MHM7A TaxID=2583233 RepID=UPI001106BD8F|nr:hypothetical protein [Rhizobium sp. MHM7A]TLX16377.1 hypothetical protein FFR93_03325 [Rhizobium sp. MHM7A]